MSNCDVCIDWDYDEPYQDYERDTATWPEALQCCECRTTIPANTEHEVASGEFDSERFEHRTCLTCVEIRDTFSCGGGVCHESLWEAMEESAFENLTLSSECFRDLSAKAKGVVI